MIREYFYDAPDGKRLMFIKGEHVTVIYHDILRSMAYSIIEYYDVPEFDNSIIIVNLIIFDDIWNVLEFDKYRRKIFYNAEHFEIQNINPQTKWWDVEVIYPYLHKHNMEIWDFLIENYDYYPDDLKEKFIFVPIRYSHYFDEYREKIQKARENGVRYDLFFSGVHDTPLRFDVINQIQTRYQSTMGIKFITATGYDNFNSWDLQAMCKFTLDYPHYTLTDQAQNTVRINDMLCAGNCVIGYINPSFLNYFDEIIYPAQGWTTDDLVDSLHEIIRNKQPNYDGYIKYQQLTENETNYNEYRRNLVQRYKNITGKNYPESVCRNII